MKMNETGANQELADTVIQAQARRFHEESIRTDWRKVLAKRDHKRAARSVRIARRSHARNSAGRIGLDVLATVGTMAAALAATVARVFGA